MHSNICTTKLIEKVKEGLSTGCVFINTATGSIVIVFFFCIHGKLICISGRQEGGGKG